MTDTDRTNQNDAAQPVLTMRQTENRLADIAEELERMKARADRGGGLLPEEETHWEDLVDENTELNDHRKRMIREAQILDVKRTRTEVQAHKKGAKYERGSGDIDADPFGEPDSIEDHRFKNPWDTSEIRMTLAPAARGRELRARAIDAIEKMQGSNDARRQTSTEILEKFDSVDGRLAQQVLSTSSPDYLRAFTKLARTNGRTEVLDQSEREAVERAMSLSSAGGGYLIPFQLDPTVILTSDGSYNQVRQIARKVVATGNVWHGVSAGAVSWSFDAEASEVSDDTPTFAQPAITIRTARGFVPISLEAAEDEQNVAQAVGDLLAKGKDDLEASVFATGVAASNQPVGIVTALVAASTPIVNSTTTDTFALADLYKLYNALPARFRSRASWLGSATTYNLVRQFGTTVANVWNDGLVTGIGADRPMALLGKPAYEAEAMDGVINALAENYMLILGDFDNYVIADRIGMAVEFIPHLFATANNLPSAQRGWFAHYRVGAGLVDGGAGFRILDIT